MKPENRLYDRPKRRTDMLAQIERIRSEAAEASGSALLGRMIEVCQGSDAPMPVAPMGYYSRVN